MCMPVDCSCPCSNAFTAEWYQCLHLYVPQSISSNGNGNGNGSIYVPRSISGNLMVMDQYLVMVLLFKCTHCRKLKLTALCIRIDVLFLLSSCTKKMICPRNSSKLVKNHVLLLL